MRLAKQMPGGGLGLSPQPLPASAPAQASAITHTHPQPARAPRVNPIANPSLSAAPVAPGSDRIVAAGEGAAKQLARETITLGQVVVHDREAAPQLARLHRPDAVDEALAVEHRRRRRRV